MPGRARKYARSLAIKIGMNDPSIGLSKMEYCSVNQEAGSQNKSNKYKLIISKKLPIAKKIMGFHYLIFARRF